MAWRLIATERLELSVLSRTIVDIWQSSNYAKCKMRYYINHARRNFNFGEPLNTLLGFYEDYKRVVVNARHELILIRAYSNNNCLVGNPTTELKIDLFKVKWRMPHVILNEVNKLRSVKLARYSINTKKMITFLVALFIVLQFLIKLKKRSAFLFQITRNENMSC